MSLKKVVLPESYNYVACFLTLDCDLKCDYCITGFGNADNFNRSLLTGREWVANLNRLSSHEDLPVTLQGGEPSKHPNFIWIINNIKKELNIDILTNLNFNVEKFITEIDPSRLRRKSKYPNIRVSYHPPRMDLKILIKEVLALQDAGFYIGVYGIRHPKYSQQILNAENECRKVGIDFRTKEFLGVYKGKLYGTYSYPESVSGMVRKRCLCRTSELVIGPDGSIYRCHHDLYNNFSPIGNIRDPELEIKDIFRECDQFGNCNPCDVKLTTNRFQIYGHTSVGIKDIQ